MMSMFSSASSFNDEISKWDVSRVTNMANMFTSASSFNGYISQWDVSKVKSMEEMFFGAASFKQKLCGEWYTSEADQYGMMDESSGRICKTSSKKTNSIRTLSDSDQPLISP